MWSGITKPPEPCQQGQEDGGVLEARLLPQAQDSLPGQVLLQGGLVPGQVVEYRNRFRGHTWPRQEGTPPPPSSATSGCCPGPQ